MLLLRYNTLSSNDLITCERTMLKFLANKLPNTGMDFAVWDWSKPELYGIVLGMLAKLDLAGTLGICKSEMLDFIIDVEKGYYATSYHSFYHAVDVVAVLYYMLTDLGVQKYLTGFDCVALLIAGLCHDIGHPGLNNVYQVNAKTSLATRYNDQSVLENYSCDLTDELITKHNLFGNVHLRPTQYYGFDPEYTDASLRQLVRKTILATDMAFHFGLLVEMNSMFEQACSSEDSEEEFDNSCPASSNGSVSSSPISPSPLSSTSSIDSFFYSSPYPNLITLDANQRELLCKVLLHAADLSNTVRPWDISKQWSDLVVEEFFNQGDLEKENNLPVSPNMDREQAHQCQISLRFGDFVVKPYFEAFAAFVHPAKVFLDTLKSNRAYWDELKNNSVKDDSAAAKTTNTTTLSTSTSTPTTTTTTTTATTKTATIAATTTTTTTTKSTSPSTLTIPNLIRNNSSPSYVNRIPPSPLSPLPLLSNHLHHAPSLTLTPSPSCPDFDSNIYQTQSGRRVSLAAGLVIIPDDFQETLSLQLSPKHRRIKRGLSGRSYSHHSLLPPCSIEGLYGVNGDSDSDDGINDHYRWPTRRKSAGPGSSKKRSSINDNYTNNDDECDDTTTTTTPTITTSTSTSTTSTSTHNIKKKHHQQRRLGRMRRSSSLDHNMIKQISALYGNGSNTEQRVVLAGS